VDATHGRGGGPQPWRSRWCCSTARPSGLFGVPESAALGQPLTRFLKESSSRCSTRCSRFSPWSQRPRAGGRPGSWACTPMGEPFPPEVICLARLPASSSTSRRSFGNLSEEDRAKATAKNASGALRGGLHQERDADGHRDDGRCVRLGQRSVLPGSSEFRPRSSSAKRPTPSGLTPRTSWRALRRTGRVEGLEYELATRDVHAS